MADFADILEAQREANSTLEGILVGQVDLQNVMQQQLDTMKNVFSNITTSTKPVVSEPPPSSVEESDKETASNQKKQNTFLQSISGKLGGILEQGKNAASKVGSGLGAIVKGTLFGALFFGLAKFLQSDTFATLLDKLLTVILPSINKFLADLGAFIADPSFENIRTLIGENKVELGILTVTILGLGRTISLVTGALKLLRVTLLAPLITMVTAAAVAMGPVGLVIAGVAALGAALFAISQSEGGFGGLVDNLKLGFLKFKDGVNKFLNFFRDKDDKLPTDSAKEFEEGQMAENIEERKQKRFEKDVQDMSDEEIQARMNDPEFAQRYEQYESRLGELGTNPDERRRRIEEFNRRNNPQQQLMPDPAQSELQFEQQQFDQRLNELQLQQAGMQGGATNVVTTDNSTLNNVVNNSTNSTIVPTTITDTNSSIMTNRME